MSAELNRREIDRMIYGSDYEVLRNADDARHGAPLSYPSTTIGGREERAAREDYYDARTSAGRILPSRRRDEW